MRHIRAICFDLDDTLWDMSAVIPRAEEHLYAWFEERYPRVTEVYKPRDLHRLRAEVGARYPELRHDLTTLRMHMLRTVFATAGYDEAPAAEAFEVFQKKRNEVELYADVEPVLRALGRRHRLFALTNGNASLGAIGIDGLFDGVITARELGIAKPEPAFFSAALSQVGIGPDVALHVGDHPENDIRAAQQAGLTAVWLNRNGAAWDLPDSQPDVEIDSLVRLPELLRQ